MDQLSDLQKARAYYADLYKFEDRGDYYARFRRFPFSAFEDNRLSSHHIDVLIAMLAYSDIHRDHGFYQRRLVRPSSLYPFCSLSERSVRRILLELQEFGILDFGRDENNAIINIVWTKKYEKGLRNRDGEKFVRTPMWLIHDFTLSPRQRHLYLFFVSWEHWSRDALNRRPVDPFFLSNQFIADKLAWKRETVRKVRQELVDLKLLAHHVNTPDHNQMSATVIVPPNLRYIFLDSAYGEHAWGTKFVPRTNISEGVRMAGAAFRQMDWLWDDWLDHNQPSFFEREFRGTHDRMIPLMLHTEARNAEFEAEEERLKKKHDFDPAEYKPWLEEEEVEEEVVEEAPTERPKLRAIEGGVAS